MKNGFVKMFISPDTSLGVLRNESQLFKALICHLGLRVMMFHHFKFDTQSFNLNEGVIAKRQIQQCLILLM